MIKVKAFRKLNGCVELNYSEIDFTDAGVPNQDGILPINRPCVWFEDEFEIPDILPSSITNVEISSYYAAFGRFLAGGSPSIIWRSIDVYFALINLNCGGITYPLYFFQNDIYNPTKYILPFNPSSRTFKWEQLQPGFNTLEPIPIPGSPAAPSGPVSMFTTVLRFFSEDDDD